MGKKNKGSSSSDLLETLGDFTSKENWDKFFSIRGNDDSFEWYAEWPQLQEPLLSLLGVPPPSPPLQILVPGCGNSRLSEHLYDAGFHSITNIDFSKVCISDMLRRNVRDRPHMRWRVMDITSMQFLDESFDAVLDKGGLDALMEPKLGSKLGQQYLSEVKRVLKSGGKFICLTLAESHVLELLFTQLRFGWNTSVHAIPHKPSSKPSLQTFMVVAEKEDSSVLNQITSSFDHTSLGSTGNQALGIHEALDYENRIRNEYSNASDILHSLSDLKLGAKGDLTIICHGRRFELILGEQGVSRFTYKAVLLDSHEHSGPFIYDCGVFLVPKTRAHEWLFSSEEGQWMVVESSKAARLIMVLLDNGHDNVSMVDIQKDLSPLVKQLAPGKGDSESQIPFMMASDGIKQRNTVHQVTSSLTGPVVVEDIVYENVDADVSRLWPSKDLKFRRLVFQRTQGLVQSEALLIMDAPHKIGSSSKSKRKGTQRLKDDSSNQMKVYHGYLASSYHMGIISGFTLISSYLENAASAGKTVKAVVIGLGAGLLPMFLKGCMSCLQIEVVELDPLMLNLAREYFGFTEDRHMKVHIADGIQFIRESTKFLAADDNGSASNDARAPVDGDCIAPRAESGVGMKVDVLIIDVDSPDSSSGMTCPAADFVEEAFLLTVKETLSEQGLFIANLVSRSPTIKDMVISRMKSVFTHLFCLQLEEDVNLVLFGLSSKSSCKDDFFPKSVIQLEKLLNLKHPEISQSIIDTTKKITCLK